MASLVLGAAGSFVGSYFGPMGSAIGWSIGSMMGSMLDPPKTQGPRLNDLKLQNSQYGQIIPKIYGRMRLAGNVIWQTDLHEHEQTTGGKGGPTDVINKFTYTASFAVAICEGPIVAVPRIWADGRIVHDNTQYSSQTSFPFTLYLGTEDQLPDPTMEAEFGVGEVPAHRGMAYIVFDEIDLVDYDNRLPMLEFEVMTEADIATKLRIIIQTEQDHEWNFFGFPGQGGIGYPYILQWPGVVGDQLIRVQRLDPALGSAFGFVDHVHEYDPATLEYVGSDAYVGPGGDALPANIAVNGISGPTHWVYGSVGKVLFEGNPVYLYHSGNAGLGYLIQNSNQNAKLGSGSFWSIDEVNVFTSREIAGAAGIPAGRELDGVAYTQDRTAAFVFSRLPSDTGTMPTRWDMIVDGISVDHGVVPDGGFGDTGGSFGHGSGGQATFGSVMMFENNREWCWTYRSAGFGDSMVVSRIDPVTKEFVWYSAGERVHVDNDTLFPFPSIMVIREGYCGVVTGTSLAIVTRFPHYQPLGPPLDEVVLDLCERAGLSAAQVDVTSLAADIVDGFLVGTRGTIRACLSQLQTAYFFDVVESEAKLKFVKRGIVDPVTVSSDDLAAVDAMGDPPALIATRRIKEEELPRSLNITFYDYEMDYQLGTQRAVRDTTLSEVDQAVELALVLSPGQAKQIADLTIFDAWMAREQFTSYLPRRYAHYEPTDVMVIDDREIRVTDKTEESNGVIKLQGVASNNQAWVHQPGGVSGLGYSAVRSGSGGGGVRGLHTALMLLDIPLIHDSENLPGYRVAMAPYDAGSWLGADLLRSRDGGVTYTNVGSQRYSDVIGTVDNTLGDFYGGNIFDELNTLQVTLLDGSPGISSTTELLVLNGLNEAVVGLEVIQFKNAQLIAGSPQSGDATYLITGMLRGRHGTEWAMNTHAPMERFVMLPANDYAMGFADLHVGMHYKALTIGQKLADALEIPFINHGVRMKPLAPVHLGGWVDGSSNATLNWSRRTRLTAPWRNNIDAPLGESSERYVVQIWNAAYTLVARVVTGLVAPTFAYTAAMQVTDFGAIQRTVYFSVMQLGSIGYGYEAQGTVLGRGPADSAPLNPVEPYTGPPVVFTGATLDDRHFANFDFYFNTDRQLAYRYAVSGLVQGHSAWYSRNHLIIIDRYFHGDIWAWANWVQDADVNRTILTDSELAAIDARARAAINGD